MNLLELVAVQAGKNEVMYVSQHVSFEVMGAGDYVDYAWQRMDHELLKTCGYLDRTRLRLKYEHNSWFPQDQSFVPAHDLAVNGVHLLDGPKAGEFIEGRPTARSILFPVLSDYRHWEYRIHRYRELLFGTWDENSGK